MKLGRCYAADVIEMNPYEEIKPYRGPMLIVRGTKDNIVNPDCSRQAQYSYSNAKLAVRMDLAKVQRNRHRTPERVSALKGVIA